MIKIVSIFILVGLSLNIYASDIKAKLTLKQQLKSITLNDQFKKPQTLPSDTKTLIFAFSKDMGKMCNDFLKSKNPSYLDDNKAVFIADISSAPSFVQNMFILPSLKEFRHKILIIDDESIAAPFEAGQDLEKTVVVTLVDSKIVKINSVATPNELKSLIEK